MTLEQPEAMGACFLGEDRAVTWGGGRVRLWALPAGRLLWDYELAFSHIAISSSGLAAAIAGSTLTIFDVTSGRSQSLPLWPMPHAALTWSASGDRLFLAGPEESLWVFRRDPEAGTFKPAVRFGAPHQGSLRVLSGLYDQAARAAAVR